MQQREGLALSGYLSLDTLTVVMAAGGTPTILMMIVKSILEALSHTFFVVKGWINAPEMRFKQLESYIYECLFEINLSENQVRL